MPQNSVRTVRVAWILFATAFAAGAVDIIGFAKLGGVFASAMTGNFALLAYHIAQGNTLSAIGSVIALLGFVSGCLSVGSVAGGSVGVNKVSAVVFLPLVGVTVALAAHLSGGGFPGATRAK